MVATRGQRKNQPAQQEEVIQPPITDYERSRDRRVAENKERMQELGLFKLSADLNNSLPQPESTKGGKSANKQTDSSDSDSSEHLLDDDDQGDSDDDDTETDEQPHPQAIKYPTSGRTKTLSSKKRTVNMAPGGRNKRVRAFDQSQVPTSVTQTRSSKRLQTSERDGGNVQDATDANDGIPDSSPTPGLADHDRTPRLDDHDMTPAEEDSVAAGIGSTSADEGNVDAGEDTEGPAQRAPKKPRVPTVGKQLDKMTKAMGRRLPIVVEAGKTRPHEPVQAAKFASEAGIIIRESMPILTHWKHYKKDHYDSFVGQLGGRLAINKTDKPTEQACTDMLRSAVKNQRYRLKQKYFNGVPANEVPTTSPVPYMTDAQWKTLVAKWTDPKNMETCEKNKQNRSKVKYQQTTGSRCYVAHLQTYQEKKNKNKPNTDQTEELDAVEAFQTCHTSSKKGISEPAMVALLNMEALRAEPVPEGETPPSSVQLVSKVLTQTSSNQFLKSVGMKPPTSSKSSSANESELREQLAAEAAAAVQGELNELKKKSEEAEEKLTKTTTELEEYKKLTEKNTKEMEETNMLLKKLLSFHGNASSST